MSKSFAVLLAVLAFAAWCGASVAAETQPAGTEAAKTVISGIIVDQNGKPVPNAKAYAIIYKNTSGDKATEPVAIGKNGRFTYTPAEKSPFGQYVFTAFAPRYAAGTDYCREAETKEIKIVLRPERKLRGKVVDDNGKPLSGVKVSVHHCLGRSGNDHFNFVGGIAGVGESLTGKNGSFVLSGLPDLRGLDECYLSLGVSKPGRATLSRNFTAQDLSSTIVIKQQRACVLEGTVYLPGKVGPAPAGTGLWIYMRTDRVTESRDVKTDAKGKFRVADLLPGKWNIVQARPRYEIGADGKPLPPKLREWVLVARTGVSVSPKQAAKVEMALSTGALIKGTVTHKTTGKPLAGVALYIIHPGVLQDRLNLDYAITDANGEFVTRACAGDVTVRVQSVEGAYFSSDQEGAEVSLKLADGEEKTGVAISVDPSESGQYPYEAMNKPVPPDFELKAGTYELTWDSELDCSEAARSWAEIYNDDVAKLLKAKPSFTSKKAKLYGCRFDGPGEERLLAVAVDESKGTGKGYDTLYVDFNRNLDLSDDKPIKIKPLQKGRGTVTEWVTVQSQQQIVGGGKIDCSVKTKFEMYWPGTDDIYLSLQRKGGWKGTIDTSKGKVECALVDTTSNGVCGEATKYKDNGEMESYGDSIFIDTNGAGRVLMMPWGSHSIRLHEISKIGGKFYSIKADGPGSKLVVEPYSGSTGTLLVRGGDIQGLKASSSAISVMGKTGSYDFADSSDGAITLPVGSYKVTQCGLSLQSKNTPQTLKITCRPSSNAEIKPGEETVIEVNGKLSLAINPEAKKMTWTLGKTEDLHWSIKIGKDVELDSIGDDDRSNPPKIKFFNKNGKLAQTATAGYT